MHMRVEFFKFIIASKMRKLGENKKRTNSVMLSSPGQLYRIYSGKL